MFNVYEVFPKAIREDSWIKMSVLIKGTSGGYSSSQTERFWTIKDSKDFIQVPRTV